MPICNKPTKTAGSNGGAHIGESKVKRVREQAYFNSYNFDAIEALSCDEDDDEDGVVEEKLPVNISQKYLKNISLQQKQHASHYHLPVAVSSLSSSSKSETTSSSNTSSGRSSLSDINYAYLQHFNAYIANMPTRGRPLEKVHQQKQMLRQHSSDSSSQDCEGVVGMRSCSSVIDLREADGQNFLLPRAMLKYNSIGSTKSMPLAVIESTTTTQQIAIGGLLPHRPNDRTDSNNASIDKLMKAATIATAAAATATATTAVQSSSTATAVAATKKTSTSSNATTSSSVHSSIENDAEQKVRNVTVIANSRKTALSQQSATGASATAKALSATTAVSSSANESAGERGRASSHQSQYSTDKSGSSGYYSSNVCSTYSSDDHIYCEPVIDILEMNSQHSNNKNNNNNSSSSNSKKNKTNNNTTNVNNKKQQAKQATNPTVHRKLDSHDALGIAQSRDMNHRESKSFAAPINKKISNNSTDTATATVTNIAATAAESERSPTAIESFHTHYFNENLRILEASIENLDRHLKNFPQLNNNSHECITSYVQLQQPQPQPQLEASDKQRSNNHLPTIMEGYDPTNQPRPWPDEITDDSLLDIDFDSFLLSNEAKKLKRNHHNTLAKLQRSNTGIDNPTFLTDEQEENHYKCAKYINSCPEDAYCVESDILHRACSVSDKSSAADFYVKRYEDQMHFQNTRELLEDVRDKIRLLSHASSHSEQDPTSALNDEMPTELTGMIKTLKHELESYLDRMNQHSELEIRQLCSGLVKNHHIVKIKKAFERRNSRTSLSTLDSDYELNTYEAIRDAAPASSADTAVTGVSVSASIQQQQVNSIRCASDPNFKMKRKSLTEVFPLTDCYLEMVNEAKEIADNQSVPAGIRSQLQRNLSFQQPVLEQLATTINTNSLATVSGTSTQHVSNKAKMDDKDSMLEWHRKKPSIWEMYYGTNRLSQSLLGKRSTNAVNNTQPVMSYPSSRPESDFTLDLPRAEQLRVKMEKEKKFRQRCRYITTFLGLIFFLLTVMVVSLVLTRGKRMFGSMI